MTEYMSAPSRSVVTALVMLLAVLLALVDVPPIPLAIAVVHEFDPAMMVPMSLQSVSQTSTLFLSSALMSRRLKSSRLPFTRSQTF